MLSAVEVLSAGVESALLDAVLLAAPPQPANVPPSIATAIVIAANLRSFIVFLPSLCDLNFKLIGLKFGKSFGSAPSLCLYCTTVVIVINTQNFR